MAATEESSFHVRISPADAREAVLEALPNDAVKRDEEDGVGRFAGDRTVCMLGRRGDALLLFQGTWRDLKGRLEEPMLTVRFADDDRGGTKVSLTAEVIPPDGIGAMVMGFLANAVTVGALLVAYFYWRKQPIDWTRVALISAAGGAAWSAIGKFLPSDEDETLLGLVRNALSDAMDEEDSDGTEPPGADGSAAAAD